MHVEMTYGHLAALGCRVPRCVVEVYVRTGILPCTRSVTRITGGVPTSSSGVQPQGALIT